MFTAGESTVRLSKPLCQGAVSKMRGRIGRSWRVSKGGRQPSAVLTRCHASPAWKRLNGELSLFCPQLFMATQPQRLRSSRLLPSCVCVHGANLHPCLVHACLSLGHSWCFRRAVRLHPLFFEMSIYTGAQLHFNSWKSPKLAAPSTVLFCRCWKEMNAENWS